MFDLKTVLLLLVTISTLAIGLTVLVKQHYSPATLAFVVFTVGIALWAITNAFFQLTELQSLGFTAAMASYYAGLMIVIPFYSFSLNFPKPLPGKKLRYLQIFLWAYTIIWGAIIGIPGITLEGVVYDPVGRLVTGPGLYFYGLSLMLFLFGGMFHLWRKKRHANLVEKRQINLIFFGMLFAAVFGVCFNLVLPLFGNYNYVWLGPDFALILVVFMAYAIVKHNLFNIRIIATELFTALLGIFLIVALAQANNPTELVVRIIMLCVYAFIAWQLLSSVRKEIQAKETLQSLLEQKTDFINMASHQLRSPLTAIRGLMTMLYDGDYDHEPIKEQKRVQKNILISVDRLMAVVNELLAAAELEKGMVEEITTQSVAPMVQQSVKLLENNYKQKGVRLRYTAPTKALPAIPMRARYLQQVFMNLLDNAQRYTPKGGQVEVRLYATDQAIIFETKDSGIGIAPEDQQRLFHKFFRADNAKLEQTGGTGLGLYIVKQIVEEHHGSITVSSDGVGQGTTFQVTLPLPVKES